jgi:tetratricopeptide (TPR) repeat protein
MIFEDIMNIAPANKENFEALKEAIRKNTVVPFTGAGMSYPYYPLWDEALKKLQEQIAHDRTDATQKELDSAETEIDRCDILEKHLGKGRICRQLCSLFDRSRFNPKNPDIRTQAVSLLPKLFPNTPLITTNLERMQEDVFSRSNVPFDDVLNPDDTKKLEVLNQQRAHGILYLHGYVADNLTDYDQLVFSKTQYNQHYREGSDLVRALQRCMSGVQLLFFGCSLRNDRTLDILKKVCGKNNGLEHFAILDLKDGEDFTDRMIQLEDEYGIRAILYPKGEHEAVRILLQQLINDLGRQAHDTDGKTFEPQYYGAESFLGRDSLVEEVVSEMGKQNYRILLVHGVAGIGKTEVCKAAYRKMREKDSNFEMPFIDLNGKSTLLAFCDRLAQGLCVDLRETALEKVPERLLSEISLRLGGKNRWVYLDNFEDLWISLEESEQHSFSDYLVDLTNAGLRILISSQVSLPAIKRISVGPLDEPDRRKLFLEILGREVRSSEQEAFTTLLNETEGHPLSIVLVASYGRECGNLKELLDYWHEIELHIPRERSTHDSLTRALALAWESVKNNRAAVLRWALHAYSLRQLDWQTLNELRDLLTPSFCGSEWTEGGHLLRGLGLITTDEDETERMLLAVKKIFADFSTEKTSEEKAIHTWTKWSGKLLMQGYGFRSSDYYSLRNRALQWLPQCFYLTELCLDREYYDDIFEMMQYADNFFHVDPVSSIDLLKKLLQLLPENFSLRAMFNERYGYLLSYTGNPEGAFAAYEEAEKLYLAKHDNLGLANVLRSRGDLLSRTGNPKGAFSAYEKAARLCQAEHYNLGLANVLRSRGSLLSNTGDLEGALLDYEEAEKLYRAEHVDLGLANVLHSRGVLLSRKGDLEGALADYEEAEKLYRAEHDNLGMANVLRSKGELLNDPENALAVYEEAEKLYRAGHVNLGLANVLICRGDLLSSTGDLKGALADYEEAEKLYLTEQHNLGQANVLTCRGDLLQKKKEWKRACTCYGKALEIYRKEQIPTSICFILSELQFCEKQIGKNSDADDHIRELEELLPNQPKPVQKYCKRKIKGDL